MIDMKPITLYEFLSLVISLGGFLTVIVTLYYLIQQTRHSAIVLKDTLFAPLYSQQLEISKLFIEHPEYRKYFYDGVDIDFNDSDKNSQIYAVAEHILDYFAAIIFQKKAHGDVIDINCWTRYIKDCFAKSPILCETLETYKGWYPQELYRMKETALIEKAKLSPQKNPRILD